jgi:hypothetical protein
MARLDLAETVDLQTVKTEWIDALTSVERFVAARDPEEVGCLYYSPAADAFVDPADASDAVPHYGCPGGVLPRVKPR